MSLVPSFDVLYCFASGPRWLVEVRRDDVQGDSDPSSLFSWFWIDAFESSVEKLGFRDTGTSDDGGQLREFEEGTLSFDSDSATFNDRERGEYMLRAFPRTLPHGVRTLIAGSLGEA